MAREILIADPNKAAHKAFEEIFKETDYNLIFSENGEDALLKMKLFKPALIIADVTMPDKNGKELCQMLKEDPNLSKVPFVLLGGPFDEEIEEEKNQVRADGTIIKPLKGEPILKLVDGLLTGELIERTPEVEEEILELQPLEEVTEAVSSGGGEEIFDLTDIVEEPAIAPEEGSLEAPAEAMKRGETRESEEGAFLLDNAIADLELPEDMGLPKAEEAIQPPEMEMPELGSEASMKVDFKAEPPKMEDGISLEEEMAEFGGIEEQYPAPLEGTAEPEGEEFGAEEVTEELNTQGMGEVSQDILEGKGLEEALAEEIEELPEDLLNERKPKDIPDEESGELEELGELGEETEVLKEEEKVLEEALRELPGEALEEGELEALPGVQLYEEELEGLPKEVSQEMDLESLAEKVLKEEGLEEYQEEVFKEGELEKLIEEAARDEGKEEIPEGALAEAIEAFTGEAVREKEVPGVQLTPERPIQEKVSGAIKELVEGLSVKILPQLTEAIAATVAERIEKTVQKIVPEMAEEAIQKEIRRLEKLKKGEDFDV